MTQSATLTEAETRYLAQVREDCEDCLGPYAEMLDLRLEPASEGVRLVASYRLGAREHESAASGETMLAAHANLRAQILVDRIRFGYSELVEHG